MLILVLRRAISRHYRRVAALLLALGIIFSLLVASTLQSGFGPNYFMC